MSVDIGEDAETVKDFVEEQGLTFPVLLDPAKSVPQSYSIRGIPTTFFINREGVIVDQHIGPMDMPRIEDFLNEIG